MTNGKILIVDDDVELARSLAGLLRRHGYEAALAHQGSDAMVQLAHARIALVISDIFMPDGDGIELLGFLKRINPTTPIVAMSGKGVTRVDGVLRMAAALGATTTLSKPFTSDELLDVVRELIGSPVSDVLN